MPEAAVSADDGGEATKSGPPESAPRRPRVDAQRNKSALLAAAKVVLAAAGVDAPAKEIADRAGVGVGTLYRHFPQRSDLVKAVLDKEIDDCVHAGSVLAATHPPGVALRKWLLRYTEFLATKDGLASALSSGGTGFDALRNHILDTLEPTLESLLAAATAEGQTRPDVTARQLMYAVGKLCMPAAGERTEDRGQMVAILLDGLRHGSQRDST